MTDRNQSLLALAARCEKATGAEQYMLCAEEDNPQ